MTNICCLNLYTLYLLEVLDVLCLFPPPSRSIFCSSPLSLTPGGWSLQIHHPGSMLTSFHWDGVRAGGERGRAISSHFFLLCAVDLPEAAPLQGNSCFSEVPPGTSTLWTPKVARVRCLTIPNWLPKLACICANSAFIQRSSVVSSEWNLSFAKTFTDLEEKGTVLL